MKKQPVLSVNELKNKLLGVIREVEKGKSFRIRKGKRLIAELRPLLNKPVITGFSQITIHDAVNPLSETWTYDAENLNRKPRK